MIDLEFIKRCEEFARPQVEKNLKKVRKKRNKYMRYYNKYRLGFRREKFQMSKAILSIKERKEIIKFCKNCPKGYEVDHIIPLSKGGSHTLDNLQYLTRSENRSKYNSWIGIQDGEAYDPNFLLKRLEAEIKENENFVICKFI